jgi:Cellulose-binding Sde182, nucleoside hydrolase-like domain
MKKLFLLLGASLILSVSCQAGETPRVVIFTDINIESGDPDDRQSLIHLLWYANELQIQGIIPDRWNARSVEACNLVIDAYAEDFRNYSFHSKNYPAPEVLRKIVANDLEEAFNIFNAAVTDTCSPLYVLVWGNMKVISKILLTHPEYFQNIRLITIGTGLMLEKDIKNLPKNCEKSKACEQLNWNGFGRNAIYDNPQFNDMWWIEINWTYSGMFLGEEPKNMFHKLSKYGDLGKHIKDVVKNESWAQYFRVGDTPSVLYVIDSDHDINNPTQSSWAGRFVKPFPARKPNYYTDYSGSQKWDYLNPCNTWENHTLVRDEATKTLLNRRPAMYNALIEKLNLLYMND